MLAGHATGEHGGLGGAGHGWQHRAEGCDGSRLADRSQPWCVFQQTRREADNIDHQQGPHDESSTRRGEFKGLRIRIRPLRGVLRPAVADEVEDVLTEVCQPLFADTAAAEQGSWRKGLLAGDGSQGLVVKDCPGRLAPFQ